MPSEDCEGGALVSEGRRLTPGANVDVLVFLPLGTPHLVTPVTAGMRWVAKAAVHTPADRTISPPPNDQSDGTGSASEPDVWEERDPRDRRRRPRPHRHRARSASPPGMPPVHRPRAMLRD
jgi:hypothetical protein